ncbi:MAG: thioredoxin family protein [Acidimicrobiales bacterium]|nr:thioredoxin family protein [Acidimicrobiales bacterium]
MVGVALDESVDAVAPHTDGIGFPVLLDRDHLLAELYAISNVPTVIWIDEDDRIVRPNSVAFGTDTFIEFTGVASEPHKDAVRAWVRDGAAPMDAGDAKRAVEDLDGDEVAARLHFRAAVHLRRIGREAAAERHFQAAATLAPMDFTIRRAAMPLRGGDPFGEEFFALYGEWEQAGKPYHGLG